MEYLQTVVEYFDLMNSFCLISAFTSLYRITQSSKLNKLINNMLLQHEKANISNRRHTNMSKTLSLFRTVVPTDYLRIFGENIIR